MAYEIYLKPKNGDLSLETFQGMFSERKHCRVDGNVAFYENHSTGVGFYLQYMDVSNDGAPNVLPDGVYRIALCVDYCQPAFFFVEALYMVHNLVQSESFSIYDPQLELYFEGWPFNDKKMFDNWSACNEDSVYEYMMSLGPDMDGVPVMPYDAMQKIWEWNYAIERLHEMLDPKMQIPVIQPVDFGDEDLTAVVWKEGTSIAVPYVDLIIFARRKNKGEITGDDSKDYDFCAVDYEDVKHLIEKYSKNYFANAFLLEYEGVPEGLSQYIAGLDSSVPFTLMNMCDVLEYEVAEAALFFMPGNEESDSFGKTEENRGR